ncbi:MAG: hypothetical protein HOP11_06860 [Saprospiraceae bacterium]|nr:hypothetical protein [Saprospiraceae bacterium]
MNKLTQIQLGFLVLLSIVSCSPTLTYLSNDMIKDNKWSQEDLKKIQFYLSDDIILTRTISNGESTIESGKIKIKNGKKIDQVIFKKGTPGILMFLPKEDRFAISFDNSSPEKYLIFGPNPKMDSRYALMAKEWDRYSGQVSYNGQIFETASHSAFSALLVNLKRAKKIERNREIAKGNKI